MLLNTDIRSDNLHGEPKVNRPMEGPEPLPIPWLQNHSGILLSTKLSACGNIEKIYFQNKNKKG